MKPEKMTINLKDAKAVLVMVYRKTGVELEVKGKINPLDFAEAFRRVMYDAFGITVYGILTKPLGLILKEKDVKK